MNEMPLVSVLMTAYNRELFIADAIESVRASVYQNWELIIVDDVSNDNTVSIAKNYEAADIRIKVFVNEKNLGDYPNRNRAASYANGKYIKYIDADDLIYPYTLNIMIDAMEKNKEAAMGISQNLIDDILPYPILTKPSDIASSTFLNRGVINVGPSGAILPTEIFRQFQGFSGKQFVGDTELWMKIAFKYPIILLQPSLVWWRVHNGQQIAEEKRNNNIIVVRHHLNKSFIESADTPLTQHERELALKKLNRRLIHNILVLGIKNLKILESFKLVKSSGISFRNFIKAIFH